MSKRPISPTAEMPPAQRKCTDPVGPQPAMSKNAMRRKRAQGNQRNRRTITGAKTVIGDQCRTSAQDALLACCEALGISATKEAIYKATLPVEGGTTIGAIVNHAKAMGMDMVWDGNMQVEKGGPEYALLQRTAGVFFVELKVTFNEMPMFTKDIHYSHCAMYNGGFVHPEFGTRGCIRGNGLCLTMEECLRTDKMAVRRLWDDMFTDARSVRVSGIWRMDAASVPKALDPRKMLERKDVKT